MKARIGKDGFDLNPHTIDKNHWYYEDKGGIEIYEERNVGEIPNNFVCRIPWRSIKASFKRYLATKKQD